MTNERSLHTCFGCVLVILGTSLTCNPYSEKACGALLVNQLDVGWHGVEDGRRLLKLGTGKSTCGHNIRPDMGGFNRKRLVNEHRHGS